MRHILGILIGWTVVYSGGTITAQADDVAAQAAKDRAIVETLLRLKGMDVNASPAWRSAVIRHLETMKGTAKYVDLVGKLKLKGVEDELFRLALDEPTSNVGAHATALLLQRGELSRFLVAAQGTDETLALKALSALSAAPDVDAITALQPLLLDEDRSVAVRVAVANLVGKNRKGQEGLLELARRGQLPEALKFTVANTLLGSASDAIREEAARYLSLPASAGSEPLPPIAELMRMPGDRQRGKQIFHTTGTCTKCHKVQGEGKDVGPNLSEIGSKLSKEAFFVAILDPSAGISHNYESYVAATSSGNVITGLLINRTEQSITLRTAEGIDQELPAENVEEFQKSSRSLMPADLQKLLSVQDLVDVVQYLTTLTKSG
ncbi:MAG: c-type cytochrome [Pirellulaceae bacterium]